MSDVLLEALRDGVLFLTLNRPEARNALSDELCLALADSCRRAADDSQVRVVAVRAAGRTFCAGGDVKAMASAPTLTPATIPARAEQIRGFMEAARLLHEMPKPTVALVRGAAAGAGFCLALACDFRLSTPEAKFTAAFAKVGLSGDYGGSYFLPRIVGSARARELYLLSPVLSGRQAHDLGLVTRVFDEETFEQSSLEFVNQLANAPTFALGMMKANLNSAFELVLSDAFDREAAHHMQCKLTEDHLEAANAFVEKRTPRFAGK